MPTGKGPEVTVPGMAPGPMAMRPMTGNANVTETTHVSETTSVAEMTHMSEMTHVTAHMSPRQACFAVLHNRSIS
jgi:hypothetical protein